MITVSFWNKSFKTIQMFFCLVLLTACSGVEETDFWPSSSLLSISTTTLSFSGEGESKSITFRADDNWRITELPSWISASSVNGTGGDNVSVMLTATTNPSSTDSRSATFSISSGDVNRTISVSQGKADETLAISSSSFQFGPEGGSLVLTIT